MSSYQFSNSSDKRYKFGDPWRPTERHPSLVVPIIQVGEPTERIYVLLEEVGDKVRISDTGPIYKAKIQGTDKPILVRSGTIIETLFMQVEYPLRRYNLFNYVYVLSFYEQARRDQRFHQAFTMLESKMRGGKVVVENPHRKLAHLSFCIKGAPSDAATAQYHEILQNLGRP